MRAEAPRGAPVRFDQGTWSLAGGFASEGATTGEAVAGPGGTVTIDVPGVRGRDAPRAPFVMTYDGESASGPHWVDRAPAAARHAGRRRRSVPTTWSARAAPPVPAARPAAARRPRRWRSTRAAAWSAAVGIAVSGRVAPARAGVAVELTATAGKRSRVRRTSTQADGSYSLLVFPIGETTRLRAVAEGIGSQTRTVTVISKVRIAVRRGGRLVTGRVRSGAARPRAAAARRCSAAGREASAHATGRFRIRLHDPRPGRYQAVFIPAARRAERSTSNTEVIR